MSLATVRTCMAAVKASAVVFDFDGTLAIKEAGETDLGESLPADHIRDKVAEFVHDHTFCFCCARTYKYIFLATYLE